jgi:hypothetical protein
MKLHSQSQRLHDLATRVLDGLNDPRIALQDDIFRAVPVTASLHVLRPLSVAHLGTLDTIVMSAVCVCKNMVLILQTPITAYRNVSRRCRERAVKFCTRWMWYSFGLK